MLQGCKLEPMNSAGIGAAANTADAVIGWYDRVRDFFSDFRPETQSMSINFAKHTCSISFKIMVPDGWKKKQRKVVLPAYRGFNVSSMIDSSLNTHKHLWKLVGQEYVLDARNLPPSETYLVTMEGKVDRDALSRFVYIKPAANRSSDENSDSYWLQSGLRNFKMLESIYTDLEIDDVNFGVNVSIDKMFKLAIPPEIKEKAASIKRLVSAASNNDRHEWFRAMRAYKAHSRSVPEHYSDSFLRLINTLTRKDVIGKHITVDHPYGLGDVSEPEIYHGLVPQSVTINAVTDLTLRSPAAKGYLKFNKKSYIERLRSEFDSPSK